MEEAGEQDQERRTKDQGPRMLEHISWQIGELVQLIRSTEVWLVGDGSREPAVGNKKRIPSSPGVQLKSSPSASRQF